MPLPPQPKVLEHPVLPQHPCLSTQSSYNPLLYLTLCPCQTLSYRLLYHLSHTRYTALSSPTICRHPMPGLSQPPVLSFPTDLCRPRRLFSTDTSAVHTPNSYRPTLSFPVPTNPRSTYHPILPCHTCTLPRCASLIEHLVLLNPIPPCMHTHTHTPPSDPIPFHRITLSYPITPHCHTNAPCLAYIEHPRSTAPPYPTLCLYPNPSL